MALRAAFLRGMGVEEADFPGRDAIAEMEKFGREYRLMLDGLMQLLRKRAEEREARASHRRWSVLRKSNPLKFLPTVDDVIVTIIAERSPGFLSWRGGDQRCGEGSRAASRARLARRSGRTSAHDRPLRSGRHRGRAQV
ncbi:type VI secretion system-associated FHA domain protein [Mesorhizobium atlanticum]